MKAANVRLLEIRLAMALGGKAAVAAGAAVIAQKGLLVNKGVIPSPRPELLNEMI